MTRCGFAVTNSEAPTGVPIPPQHLAHGRAGVDVGKERVFFLGDHVTSILERARTNPGSVKEKIGRIFSFRRTPAIFCGPRRRALTPGAVGLPARRRWGSPGLRLQDVAELAGVSTSWYASFELGYAANMSGADARGDCRRAQTRRTRDRVSLPTDGHPAAAQARAVDASRVGLTPQLG